MPPFVPDSGVQIGLGEGRGRFGSGSDVLQVIPSPVPVAEASGGELLVVSFWSRASGDELLFERYLCFVAQWHVCALFRVASS